MIIINGQNLIEISVQHLKSYKNVEVIGLAYAAPYKCFKKDLIAKVKKKAVIQYC